MANGEECLGTPRRFRLRDRISRWQSALNAINRSIQRGFRWEVGLQPIECVGDGPDAGQQCFESARSNCARQRRRSEAGNLRHQLFRTDGTRAQSGTAACQRTATAQVRHVFKTAAAQHRVSGPCLSHDRVDIDLHSCLPVLVDAFELGLQQFRQLSHFTANREEGFLAARRLRFRGRLSRRESAFDAVNRAIERISQRQIDFLEFGLQ